MANIASYSGLQSAFLEYMARNDSTLTGRFDTFVQFFEAKMNRELFVRQMEGRAYTIVDITTDEPEFLSLPADFQSMRRVRVSSVTGKPHLDFLSGTQMDEYRLNNANVSGCPKYFTIFGTEIELAPTPSSNVTIEMIYRKNIPTLVLNDPNWLLTLAPDLYLYGCLLEASPYLKDDARIQVWGLGFQTALDGLNRLGLTSTFNAGPMQVRSSSQTP